MPSYEGIRLLELKRLAAQREISLAPWATLDDFKAQLEQADDEHNAFHRFLDLPPELRERVYTQFFNSYIDDDNPKCQPPISYASRTVRQEALPVFYGCCWFSIRASCGISRELKPITDGQRIADVLSPNSAAFMKSISALELGRIRSLRLNVLGCEIHLKLDARDQKDPITIRTPYIVDLGSSSNSTQRERKEQMLSDLRTIALGVAAREGPLKLREGDLERLYETVRIAFVALYPDR